MQTARKIFNILRNKYLIAFVVFAAVMLFFDHNNIFEQWDRRQQLNDLQAGKKFYQEQIKKTKTELADLQNNPAALEKYARENYFMKKDNEDLFIIDKLQPELKNK